MGTIIATNVKVLNGGCGTMYRTLATPLVASEYDLYLFVNSMGELHFSELFDSLFDRIIDFCKFCICPNEFM